MTMLNQIDSVDQIDQSAVAIVGMAGRFPGAKNVDELWQNVRDGAESITFFSDEELLAAGVSPHVISDPNYVKASPVLSDLEKFDAFFFDYSAKEALYMDPQQRVFLECAWEALENAGYQAGSQEYTIGIYGGSSISLYLLNDIIHGNQVYAGHMTSSKESAVFGGNVPESLTTRVAYKLNLTGPAVHVSTACSTSLVAIHSACQSLLNGECEIALAGGVSYLGSQKEGYLYEEGLVLSPDGHCRSFDGKGQGTLWGNGVGIVVLKMLDEALADGDHIYAVIKGSAINNDGNLKVSHSAPSVDAQARAIYQAQDVADIDPATITYVEAHGTATPLGDPIEIAALTQAFRAKTEKTSYCAIASLKSNIGHLSEASGVAGLIKTALALKHQQIPPSLHFETPNPQIDFEESPFYVNTKLTTWDRNGSPRRAGVSSFGMGGTNAHIVLEEWDTQPERDRPSTRDQQLLLLSAKTPTALETATTNLINHLEQHPDLNREDAAYTLAVGRKAFKHRRIAVVGNTEAVSATVGLQAEQHALTNSGEVKPRSVVFMFSGQGSQYVNMAQDLYKTEAVFQEQVDRCCELLKPQLKIDLRDLLYPAPDQTEAATEKLNQTSLTQPALFVVEYALAQLWMNWGIKPAALIGHSIGEYVAATLAGVFSLEDALTLVAKRGELMQSMAAGSMLAVPLPEHKVKSLLQDTALEIATVNSPANCVVSGSSEAVEVFVEQLASQNIDGRRLHTSHAFHSTMMEPVLEPFALEVGRVQRQTPSIPFVSNVTGTWITPEDATDPNYYARQLRSCVRFADGVAHFFDDPDQILLEVGPGRTLSTLAKRHPNKASEQITLTSLRHPKETISDSTFVLKSLGALWLAGTEIDWQRYYGEDTHYRLPLPTYPFERQRYWIEPKKVKPELTYAGKKSDIADWFYQPSWKRASLPAKPQAALNSPILVFLDDVDLGHQLIEQLAIESQAAGTPKIITVKPGERFASIEPNAYTISPSRPENYHALMQALQAQSLLPKAIIHLWNTTEFSEARLTLEQAESAQALGFYSLLYLAQSLGEQAVNHDIEILVVSNHLQTVIGETAITPEKATLIGPVRVIPQEYENIYCRSIDVAFDDQSSATIIRQLIEELRHRVNDKIIAYRGNSRWVETFEPIQLEPASLNNLTLKNKGVYLITGGMGGMGLVFAEHLAKTVQAKLVLTGRSPLPERSQWASWLENHAEEDPNSTKIRKLQQFEAWGAEALVVSADVTNEPQMAAAIAQAQQTFGSINGMIHTAGVPGGGVIPLKTRDIAQRVLAPKVEGTILLDTLLKDEPLDFRVLCSSMESALGTAGQIDYCAANNFLDAYAHAKAAEHSCQTLSINWDAWQQVGMAVETAKYGLDNKVLEVKALEHHLFDKCIVEKNQEIYVGTLKPDIHWIVGEHVVLNMPSLVGTAYLEIARSAYECHSGQATVELQDVYFLQFLFVEGEERDLKVILKPNSENIEFSIQSLDSASGVWVEHAQGKIIRPDFPVAKTYDISELEASCDQEMTVPDLQALPDYTHYGPRWLSNIQWRKASENHNLALMELPAEFSHDLDLYKFHPSMVDTATYVVADVLPNELSSKLSFFKEDSTYLPYFYERVQIKGALPAKFYSYTTRELRGRDWSINLSFIHPDGTELVAIDNYVLKYTDAAYSIKDNQDARQSKKRQAQAVTISLDAAVLPAEGVDSLERILQSRMSQMVVSTVGFEYQKSLLDQAETEDAADASVLFDRPLLTQDYEAPQTETEKAIAAIWQQVLGIKDIGVDDNFFDLGGDSLIIVQILQELKRDIKADLTINDLLNANTIAELAQVIDPKAIDPHSAQSQKQLPPCLVKFREGSADVAPIFLVHPIAGTTRNYVNLPNCLESDQPLYAIQYPKWTDEPGHFKTIEALAAYYLEAVRQVQPQGPYFLSGYSGGVYATYEMAQQLTAAGEEVAFLALIDKPHWETAADKPNWNNPDFGTTMETMVYYADIRTPKPNGESHLSDYLKLESFEERLQHFIKNSPWIQDMMPPDSTEAEWQTFWEIFVELRIMNVSYSLKKYNGQAIYIAANIRDIYSERFNEKPWFEVVPDLVFEEVPGDHVTMWHQPNIQMLSGVIQKYANTREYRSAASAAQFQQIQLDPSALLEAAQEKTGLDDFGDERFLAGLEQLTQAVNREAELHLMGRKFMQALIDRLLVNRLQIQAELKQHPDILKTPIKRPLFILGLPRTGSTYLHNLLCQDPTVRWLPLWEAYIPFPSPNPKTYTSDPRIKQTQDAFKNYEFFTPESTAMHKYDANAPEECVWLLQNDFACTSFSFLTQIPSYTAWLEKQAMVPVYDYYRQQLQLLDWQMASERWVLKNPFHLGDLAALETTFPEAQFVQTHRDPARVLASYCRLIENLRPVYSDHLDKSAIGQEMLKLLAHQVEQGMSARSSIANNRICDINFRNLVNDPIGTVQQIYTHFGYEMSQEMNNNLQQYISDNPRYKHGKYSYSLEEFDLDTHRVQEKFEGYIETFEKYLA